MSRILRLSAENTTAETLAVMMCVAADPRILAPVRILALEITKGCETPEQKTRALYKWVRANIGYVYDPPIVEYLHRPWSLPEDDVPGLLELALAGSPSAASDCDCHAVTMASLLNAVGIEPAMVVTMTKDSEPYYEHVHCAANVGEAYGPEQWVHLDTSLAWVDYDRPHTGIKTSSVRLTDLDRAGEYERQVLLGQADGAAGLVSGVLDFVGTIAKTALGARAARTQARAIEKAARLQTKAEERIAIADLELAAATEQLGQEQQAYWDAVTAARRESLAAKAAAPIILGGAVLLSGGILYLGSRRRRR